MKVTCSECLGTLEVEDHPVGASVQCPSCFGRIEIPSAMAVSEDVSPPAISSVQSPPSDTLRKSDFDLPDDLDLPELFEVTELPAPVRQAGPQFDSPPERPPTTGTMTHGSPSPVREPRREKVVPTPPPRPTSPPATLFPDQREMSAPVSQTPAAKSTAAGEMWDRVLQSFEGVGPLSIRLGRKIALIIKLVGLQIWHMVKFYSTRRTALLLRSPAWDWFGLSSMNVSRELIIPPTERVADGWQVELPPCCVACGLDTDAAPQLESRTVDEVVATVWILLVAVPVALYIWWYYGPWWMAAVMLVTIGLGYSLHRSQPVEITFHRCSKHHDSVRYPELFLIGEGLLVRVGQRRVKKEYRRLQDGGQTEFVPPAPPDE